MELPSRKVGGGHVTIESGVLVWLSRACSSIGVDVTEEEDTVRIGNVTRVCVDTLILYKNCDYLLFFV